MSLPSATATASPTENLEENGTTYLAVAVISVIMLCIVLVVLIITLLVLLLKKSKRKVVVIKPPEIANPHYNHLAILEETPQTNILKRWSLRIMNRFSVISSYNGDTLTRQSSNTLPRQSSNTLPSRSINSSFTSKCARPSSIPAVVTVSKYITVVDEDLEKGREYDTMTPSDSDLLTITVYKRDDPEVYEIPQRNMEVESLTYRPYSQLCIPVYSDFCQDGFFVLTEEQRKSRGSLSEHFVQSDHCYNKLQFFEQSDNFWIPSSTTAGLYTQLSVKKYREIPHDQIKIETKIGSGNFGAVFNGAWVTRERTTEVAIKVLKTDSNVVERIKFLQEAAIMGQFHHPNIIHLHGVITMREPTMIALELASKGDLLTYLRKLTPSPSPRDQDPLQRLFIKFACEIASGMEHLSNKKFIHRDLAARNILLSEELSCKIGDFGMARDLLDDNYYNSRGGKIPIKWTAPEALLYKKYSVDSDVWSYGILLYEIWSLGKEPFPDSCNSEMIGLAKTGICHYPAPGLSRAIYALMVDCWNPDHSKRPTFSKIYNYMNQSASVLLHWSERDLSISPLAHVLGVSLNESKGLYKDLQGIYREDNNISF